jgi:hypothetical protein
VLGHHVSGQNVQGTDKEAMVSPVTLSADEVYELIKRLEPEFLRRHPTFRSTSARWTRPPARSEA